MQVVILAAGISTRTRPLTDSMPKPMLPVLGKPMLEYLVRNLAKQGLTDIIITTHFCPEVIRAHFGDGKDFGVQIIYSHEDRLMNTAGSLKLLEGKLSEDFMIIGGNDFLPKIDLADFIEFHRRRHGIGTIAFKRLEDESLLPLFGQGTLDENDTLTGFVEKPPQIVSRLIHTTYQIYSPRVLRHIPVNTPCSIPEYLIHKVLQSGEKIYGYRTDSPFICVSTLDQYERAHEQLVGLLQQ